MTNGEQPREAANVAAPLQTIIFVEDESRDYLFAREELQKLKLRNPIHRAHDTNRMMNYLHRAHRNREHDAGAVPCLIITELRLPNGAGLDGLATVRSNATFRSIPIIAISSVDRIDVLKRAVEAGANGYLVKPFNREAFASLAAELRLPLHFGSEATKTPAGGKEANGKRKAAAKNPLTAAVERLGLFSL